MRPPGLFDTPGAVAGPAMFAALLGLVFAVSGIADVEARCCRSTFAVAGLAAIYLSQVRISLVVTVVMMAVYAASVFRQGRRRRARRSSAFSPAPIVVGGFVSRWRWAARRSATAS